MSSVIFHLPPPMQKRAFHLMLAHAKQVQEEGEPVLLTHCALPAGTCSSNLAGSRLICAACRYSTQKSARDIGMELIPLHSPQTEAEDRNLSRHENSEIAEGVNSCLITLIRVMKHDLNRLPLLRTIKRQNFRTATVLLKAMTSLLEKKKVHRIEVLNGRYACMKVGLIAAQKFGLAYNTLDFSCTGKPMVFRGHTPHDRTAIQARIRRNPVDLEIAEQYYTARKDKRFNVFAGKHQYSELPATPFGTKKNIAFFLSSQDECESLGPEWRSPFRNTAKVIWQACKAYPDFFFCVRFHPNQANILSDITSDYDRLKDLPNLRIFYPTDEVNTYSLIEWCDAVVTFASTVAIEACWSGKSVVQLGPSFFDQLDISYTPESVYEFLQLLGVDMQAWSTETAAQFANYDMYDFDELRYLDYSSGDSQPVGFRRKGSLFASAAKKMNNIANNLLRKYVTLTLPRNRTDASPERVMDTAPIVITGCPRSGTQMMARVFGNLSDDFFLITEHSDKNNDVPEEDSQTEDHRLWWENFEYQDWNDAENRPNIDVPIPSKVAIGLLRNKYLQLAKGRRIVIKNPSHILYPELVRQIFPNAKFVYCMRNPWHTLQSMTKKGHDRLLLRSPRAADEQKSLLYRAAIGWGDAFASFQQSRDDNWVVAEYGKLTASPRAAIATICDQLGILGDANLDIARAATIPQASRNDFYPIKNAYLESHDKEPIVDELRAGCEEFGYPLGPSELEGGLVTYAFGEVTQKLKRKTVKHLRRRAG